MFSGRTPSWTHVEFVAVIILHVNASRGPTTPAGSMATEKLLRFLREVATLIYGSSDGEALTMTATILVNPLSLFIFIFTIDLSFEE